MKTRKAVFVALLVCVAGVLTPAELMKADGRDSSTAPAPRKLRYINPLPLDSYPLETIARSRAIGGKGLGTKGHEMRHMADITVIRYKGKYYLFASRGWLWVSDDLVNWEYHPVSLPDAKPTWSPNLFEYQGYLYVAGAEVGWYRCRDPLGPWEHIGEFKDQNGKDIKLFDPMTFVDDDGRVYVYFAGATFGRGTGKSYGAEGTYGVELDRKDLTRFVGPPKHLFRYEKSHVWERYGDNNEQIDLSWIEGQWMTKHNGTYYLQYSASGTDWKTYAVGVYTCNHPLGPFTYAPRNPILADRHGLINGTGHHSVVEGPDGNLWAFYTLLYRNWDRFERRVGMDPVGFDEKGNMFVNGPTETPQWAPGVKAKPWLGNDSGSMVVSLNKFTYDVSSERPGRDATYAFDNNVRTWWEPAENDAQPWLMLDLGCANANDPHQTFVIDSSRILFSDAYLNIAEGIVPGPYQYKIEVSSDGQTFKTVLDKTQNTKDHNIEFDEIAPAQCRYVRLTITGAPKKVPIGILEFTVFGKPVESGSR